MVTIWQDLRLGLRQLLKDKGFAIAAILTLTLGIGATATIFTVVNSVILKVLPFKNPDKLVILQGNRSEDGEVHTWPISQMDFADWRKRTTLFSDMSVFGVLAYNLEQGDQSQHLSGELVNANYFQMLGVKPVLGRFFTPAEDVKPLADFVVVLGYDLWRNAFGADPRVLGRKIRLNDKIYEVVGVGPRDFRGMSDEAQLWVPSMLPPVATYLTIRGLRFASGVARLKPGISVTQAQKEMDSVTAQLAVEIPNMDKGLGARVTQLKQHWFGSLYKGLLLLTIGASILLILACINVASLLLTRAVAKQRAWGIRVALGASRQRLVRQMLTESILLSLIGAVGGLLLARWATSALIAFSGTEFPAFVHVSAEPRVIVVVVGLAVLCGLAFGLAPIWLSYRSDLTRSLGRDEKLPPRGKGWHWFQNTIVVAQVALALTLSVNALLMAKGFREMLGQDLGFRSQNLLTFRVDTRGPKYADDKQVVKLVSQQYLPRIAAVPGVNQLAISDPAMPTDEWSVGRITVQDHDSDAPDGTYAVTVHAVSPTFFDVLGVPLLKGRPFNSQDTQTNAVIVSKTLADKQWPGKEPLGQQIKIGLRDKATSPWLTVVGIASEVRHEGFKEETEPAPAIYLSLLQQVWRPLTLNFLIRPKPGLTTDNLRTALHREMAAINPDLPDYDMATMQERLDKQTGKARFQVILISVFATLALVLAAIGIYGVISYSVTQRTREIAIRMSLGADRGRILRMVVARGAVVGALGLALGLTAIFLLSRLLVNFVFATNMTDPVILFGASVGFFLVTLIAHYLPARRAAIVDPMSGLRLQ